MGIYSPSLLLFLGLTLLPPLGPSVGATHLVRFVLFRWGPTVSSTVPTLPGQHWSPLVTLQGASSQASARGRVKQGRDSIKEPPRASAFGRNKMGEPVAITSTFPGPRGLGLA